MRVCVLGNRRDIIGAYASLGKIHEDANVHTCSITFLHDLVYRKTARHSDGILNMY